MAKYIIIEDERLAYEEIRRMMQRLRPDYMLTGWAMGVEQAVLQLASGGIDLMIVDIRLSEGLSFEIFERTAADIPVIFTTAYDEYALRAFKVNSIDYSNPSRNRRWRRLSASSNGIACRVPPHPNSSGSKRPI